MSFDVRTIAERKYRETSHPQMEWLAVLETARQSLKLVDIDYPSLEQFALASRNPKDFTSLVRLIYQYGRSHPFGEEISDVLFSYVNESPFSLSDWIEALAYFYGWLDRNRRPIDFLSMLEYLQCCVASPDAREMGQTLSALVRDMLEVAGYEDKKRARAH